MHHFLYVIAAASQTGPVKLGISADPERRLRQLQTGRADPLRLYHREPVLAVSGKLIEKLLHRDLAHRRLHGEWFNLAIDEAIDHVGHAVIRYEGVDNLAQLVRSRRI